jgi:F-type H+-transporting ATPase subunit gamma
VSSFPEKNLVVVMSTDKGLCGGVNTILARMTRQMLARIEASGKKYQMFILGEKGRGALRRTYSASIIGSATERVMPYNFELSASLAQDIIQGDFDAIHLVYNEFKSAIAYVPSIKSITPLIDTTSPFLYPFEGTPIFL